MAKVILTNNEIDITPDILVETDDGEIRNLDNDKDDQISFTIKPSAIWDIVDEALAQDVRIKKKVARFCTSIQGLGDVDNGEKLIRFNKKSTSRTANRLIAAIIEEVNDLNEKDKESV